MALCDWLLSLSIVFPRLIHVVIWIGTSFLCMAKQHSVVWIHCILFIHQWMDIWVVSTFACYKQCFSQHLCTSISAYECFLWDIFLGVESLGHMIILCLGFWGTAKLLYKAAASFYFHRQYMKVLVSLHLCRHLYLFYWFLPSYWKWSGLTL